MAHEFLVPDVGEGLTEVVVEDWFVAVGEEVGLDAPLVQVETDKAVVDIPSPVAGFLLHQGAAAGETLEVGRILAVVGEAGETWEPGVLPARQTPAESEPVAPIVGTLPEASTGAVALPVVRKLAAELGVDIESLTGSGPEGRITKEDVLSAGSGPVQRRPVSPLRRAIAARVTKSWREIPHVTTFGSARGERLFEQRRHLVDASEGQMPLEAFLISLIIPLLEAHPEFNATLSADEVLLRKHYDIGVAVDTPEGLMLAVVKDAAGQSVLELADVIVQVAKSARSRSLTPDELRGATFTVSNIGAVGGRYGTPIIPSGTSALVSFGRAEVEAVIEDGAVVPGLVLPISLSYDHRLIDGALGRTFMAGLVEAIETATFS